MNVSDVMHLRFFFFKQKTAYEVRISDWSSDVCSSDLKAHDLRAPLTQALPLLCQRGRFNYVEVWKHDDAGALALLEWYADRATAQIAKTQIGRASCRERVCQYV